MRIIVTQPIKYLSKGCLPREVVLSYFDKLWKPFRFLRNIKTIKFIDRLHHLRISLNRIIEIHVEPCSSRYYLIHVWYLSRRGNEYCCFFEVHR